MPTLIAPLFNYSFDGSHQIVLSEAIQIDSLKLHLVPYFNKAFQEGSIRHRMPFNHCLILRDPNLSAEYPVDLRQRLEEVILRLRLYKSGGVFLIMLFLTIKVFMIILLC